MTLSVATKDINYLKENFFSEINSHKVEVPLYDFEYEIDFEEYQKYCDAGLLYVYILRHDQEDIGYSAFYVSTSPRYPNKTFATQDIFYLKMTHRVGHTASKFIRLVDDELRKEGISIVQRSVPKTASFEKLLTRNKYNELETIFYKDLIWVE